MTEASHFERLEVTPAEIVFQREGGTVPLRVVARWTDGNRRLSTNPPFRWRVDGMILPAGVAVVRL